MILKHLPSVRICFVGESFVNGTGDRQCLGWAGRICINANIRGYDITYYNLGVRRETSAQLKNRWHTEVSYRLPKGAESGGVFRERKNGGVALPSWKTMREAKPHRIFSAPPIFSKTGVSPSHPHLFKRNDGRLVFSFGVNDTTIENGKTRVELADSLENTRTILSEAKQLYPVLMISPPPVVDEEQNQRISHLSKQFALLCNELNVPYLDVFSNLLNSNIWIEEAKNNDGAHPRETGYQEFAQIVQNWSAWLNWFPTINNE